jgi:ankyrin repeat protein
MDEEKLENIIEGAIYGDLEMTKEAIINGINPETEYRGFTSLRWAVQEGHFEVARLLIEYGADLENREKENGFSIFDTAVGECSNTANLETQINIVQLLIDKGVDINGKTANGSVLHTACAYGMKEVVELLLRNGISINIKDSDSRFAIDYAAEYGHNEIVELIKTTPQQRV